MQLLERKSSTSRLDVSFYQSLCFYSFLLGKEARLVIPWIDVTVSDGLVLLLLSCIYNYNRKLCNPDEYVEDCPNPYKLLAGL